MKTTLKKALCVGLIAAAAVSTVSAAKKKTNPYKDITKQKDPNTKKVYNFDGMEIILADWWTDPSRSPASKQEEDTFAWHQWINKAYNVNIIQKAMAGWGSQPQFVANFCITGGDENYAFFIDGRSANTGVKAGLFTDLSTIKSVNYKDAKKYDQGVVNQLVKGKSFYAFNWGKPEPKEGVFFNKRILEENGFDPNLPYDLQKQGKWTWATFEDMCKQLTKDTNNDGVNDQYALTTFSTTFAMAALDSNGGSYIGVDSNGKFYNNAGSDKSMEAWNWIAHMASTYQQPKKNENDSWDWFYSAFVNGEAAFLVDQEYNAQPQGKFSQMKDDFGFVCFPLGPNGDQKYHTIHSSNMIVIPSVYDSARAEKIAKAIDLWLDPTPGYEGDDVWKESYYASFRDERAVEETLQIMMDNPNPRYDILIPGFSTGDMVYGIWGGWVTPAEAYENTKNSWQSLIDDANR